MPQRVKAARRRLGSWFHASGASLGVSAVIGDVPDRAPFVTAKFARTRRLDVVDVMAEVVAAAAAHLRDLARRCRIGFHLPPHRSTVGTAPHRPAP